MTENKIDRRVVTIDGTKVNFTYDLRTREVIVKALDLRFIATSYDYAPDEIRERAKQGA